MSDKIVEKHAEIKEKEKIERNHCFANLKKCPNKIGLNLLYL